MFKLLSVAAIVGGGAYFLMHYQVEGLDSLKVLSKTQTVSEPSSDDPIDDLMFISSAPSTGTAGNPGRQASFVARPDSYSGPGRPLRIGSWALSGFGPSKLASDHARLNLIRVLKRFDIIALQQITAAERDLVPRLVDAMNEGGQRYDFVLGEPTGPDDRSEQLAVLFDVERAQVDRSQTYSISDPHQRMTYDPMVAWFRASEPSSDRAWTFSVVNVRIDLSRAAAEVALLPNVFSSVRGDGRGEDDVVMLGLFQADDSYLVPHVMGEGVVAGVRSSTTDIFSRHQTCNVLIDQRHTSEYLGRGGPVDFLRVFNLNLDQAEAVSSHLPVFAEFAPVEGGTR